MITGSHIPDDRNGIKFNKSSGEILKEDEEGIRRQSVNLVENLKIDPLPKINSSAEEHYRKRYIDLLPSNYFEGLKIGVYQHSSVSRGILVDILSYLGADITKLNYSDTFIPVDTEAIRDHDIDLAKKIFIVRHNDNDLLDRRDWGRFGLGANIQKRKGKHFLKNY
mgnify:CR=1 FL=1